jgi:hypothetical protein
MAKYLYFLTKISPFDKKLLIFLLNSYVLTKFLYSLTKLLFFNKKI